MSGQPYQVPEQSNRMLSSMSYASRLTLYATAVLRCDWFHGWDGISAFPFCQKLFRPGAGLDLGWETTAFARRFLKCDRQLDESRPAARGSSTSGTPPGGRQSSPTS